MKFALELRHHQADCFGRACARRNNVLCRCAGPSEVLVHQIEGSLIVRVRVRGGHQTALYAELLVQEFANGRKAVPRARGVCDDMMLVRIVCRIVYAQDMVRSSSVAGAVIITFFAPASRCARTSAAAVKTPVDSITMSTPSALHGSRAGSF